MSTLIVHQSLLGLVRVLATTVLAGWIGSPMSWSPDGRWLTYTTAPGLGQDARQPGWMFDATARVSGPRETRGQTDHRLEGSPNPVLTPGTYRIWASQRDGAASVLIEESAWPLSAARWGPRGRSLAFGRFVPDSPEPSAGPTARGHVEVVIQDGLERRRTLFSLPAVDLDDAARTRMSNSGPSWSADGQFLAFPQLGASPSIVIIRVDSRRAVRTLDNAILPSWSPDGTKLAFLRREATGLHTLHVVERQGGTFGAPRAVSSTGRIAAPVGWGVGGRSMLAVVERAKLSVPDVDLARIGADSGETTRIFSLVAEGMRRRANIRGMAIDFDRNEEVCFFSVDLDGRDADVCWSIPRDQLPYKRFHPIDPSLRIGSIAIAPDGRGVAMRFGVPDDLSPPVVCELDTDHVPPTEHTTLIVPDESARKSWLDLLARTARALLAAVTPPAVVEGRPVERRTLLPVPDEISAALPVRGRFATLARFGSSLCGTHPRPGAAATAVGAEPDSELDVEDRLFFDYLRGDYIAAAAALEALEARPLAHERRMTLLGVRAMILRGQGEIERAQAVADYVLTAVTPSVHLVEETPIGRSLTRKMEPVRDWAAFLASRVGKPRPRPTVTAEPNPMDRDEAPFANPFAPLGPQGMDLRRPLAPAEILPIGPNGQDERREAFRVRMLELQRIQRDAQQRRNQPPPLPQPIERQRPR